ncbi:hypothetical protein B0T17DRAFT_612485 [Bombardia bombarda]|uniref:Sec16 N-terminal domain-containing protein n=1 Tax=Bombardia bombarda TaxID=252184 RepID=A0AA39XKG2_9PEZI|nr:hypothetical protein B0T17DRAFT_612485 [Bombardia bombarda]
MLSEAPHASWNPALRPNSIADLPQSTPKDLPSAETSPALLATDDVLDDAHNKSLGPDAWFPNYDTGDGALEEEAPDAPSATELPGQPDIADATVQEPSDASSTSSKHTNRMSFARTVSHEVNWMDDDDPEWNLPRTATDPFKAMAPSNRTNSFPVVPPLAHQSENELDRPVPFNEAEEVIRELEQDDIADSPREFSPLSDTPEGESYPNEVEGLDASHQSIGGELREAAEEASEARYTEGVPLISSTEDNQPQNDSHEDERDPFGDDPASEEDDFFSSVRVGGVQPDEDVRPTIERKSTRQVLDAMDVGLAKESFAALEESAEEVDSTWEPTQPNTANEVPSVPTVLTSDAGVRDDEQPKAETGEDLDAKWKEMFADEDEFLSDELLPDDSTETKEVDPTAFIIDDDEGFLDDSPEEPLADSSEPLAANAPEVPQTGIPNGRYLPPSTPTVNAYSPAIPTTALPPAHPYLPAVTPITQFPAVTSYGIPASNPPAPTPYGYGAQRPKLEEKKAQSFADKAKGGYTSPPSTAEEYKPDGSSSISAEHCWL